MDSNAVAFWIKNIIASLVLFPTSPMIVVLFGVVLAGRKPRLGRALIGLGIVVLATFSLPIVANTIAARDERDFPPLDPSIALPADAAIVVLSGGAQLGAIDYGGETINQTTLARIRSAARLAARTHLPILVSGGRLPAARRSEAEQMAEVLRSDFDTPVRWIEEGSLDTRDNARLSVPMLEAAGVTHAILVTDVSHMRRARALFEAAGMPVTPAPTDYYASGPTTVLSFIPNGSAIRRSAWSMHEWLGLLWMKMRD